jgi:hypothetical protein
LDSEDFKITVTFSDLDSWQQELKSLDGISGEETSSNALRDSERSQISREERERFIAVYGLSAFEDFSRTRNKNNLILPPKVAEAFTQKTKTIFAKTAKEVHAIAKGYLVTTTSENEELVNDQLWPIVETVLI